MPHVSTYSRRFCIIIDFDWLFSFDGQNFENVNHSKYPHGYTMGLGNYRGKAFTTGCAGLNVPGLPVCNDNKVATEMLDLTTNKWTDGSDYPFVDRSV